MGFFKTIRQAREANADPEPYIESERRRLEQALATPVVAYLGPLHAAGGLASSMEAAVTPTGSGMSRRKERNRTAGVTDVRAGRFALLVLTARHEVRLYSCTVDRSGVLDPGEVAAVLRPGEAIITFARQGQATEVVVSPAGRPPFCFEVVTMFRSGRALVEQFAAALGTSVT